jgi:DNA-binding transcriptional LysR family regulator
MLGVTLLDRHSKPARPTRAGAAAYLRCVAVLRATESCKLAELGGFSWVINPDGCGFRTQLDRALAAAGHSLEVSAESWGTVLQLALIAHGAGLGLVAQRIIGESQHAASLRAIDVDDFRPMLSVWLVRAGALGPLSSAVDVLATTVERLLAADVASMRQVGH